MADGVIVFDVNETLIDLSGLDTAFAETFGPTGARREWFDLLLRWSLVQTLSGRYRDFSALARDSLLALAATRKRSLSDNQLDALMERILSLSPHPDVEPALARLRQAGLRLATLTNSNAGTLRAQMENAGLADYFERLLSVDAIGKFKPHPDVYRMAAEALGVGCARLRLVATHDWDVTGAMRAGCAAAFVARGRDMHPSAERPDIVGEDLIEVTEAIIRLHGE